MFSGSLSMCLGLLTNVCNAPGSIDIDCIHFRHLHKLPELLESADLDVRIAGGESISLMYELSWEQDEVRVLYFVMICVYVYVSINVCKFFN